MIPSLRVKLIVAFVFVIFLSLLLASSAFVFLLREYQTQIKLGQLENIAGTMSVQARLLERAGASPKQIALFMQEQAKEVDVRILLLDPQGIVVEDSQDELRGQQVSLPGNLQRQSRRAYSFVYRGNTGGENLFLVISGPRPISSSNEPFISRAPAYSLVLAVPQQSVASAWLELAPSLSLAALISLVASVGVAILLSRSISRPISAITRASEEMATGNYDQSIPVSGRDEIARMAAAFNTMAAEVKASHRTLRDFLANVSHELKTPLTSIQGFSQAMVDGAIKDAGGYAAAGRIINEEAERMRRLVEDLLYLSKIESGQIPMEKLPVNLEALIDSCVKKVEIQAKRAEIPITVQVDSLPVIRGDAHRLEQVFINLLDNALKHTPNGGAITIKGRTVPAQGIEATEAKLPVATGRLRPADPVQDGGHNRLARPGQAEASSRSVEPEGDAMVFEFGPPRKAVAGRSNQEADGREMCSLVQFAVHNTGSTIAPEELDKVFERFYQVDKSRAKSIGGTGLGLAIVKEIVQAHGGFVEVRSEPLKGTEFIVYLPTEY